MRVPTSLKTLALLGIASLGLAGAPSHADNGFVYFYGNQNANPWIQNQAMQQARFQAELRNRIAQLDQRQDAQLKRILNGMEDGRLTSREAVGLLREHLAISALERKYLADGRLGPNELRDLEARLEEANRHITFENRDRERERDRDNRDNRDPRGPAGHPGDWERR